MIFKQCTILLFVKLLNNHKKQFSQIICKYVIVINYSLRHKLSPDSYILYQLLRTIFHNKKHQQ